MTDQKTGYAPTLPLQAGEIAAPFKISAPFSAADPLRYRLLPPAKASSRTQRARRPWSRRVRPGQISEDPPGSLACCAAVGG
jgi:hypothetical protein